MRALLAAALLAALPSPAGAKGGAWPTSAHGRKESGVARLPGVPRGECAHCHGAPRDRTGRRRDDGNGHAQLFTENDNALCAGCHPLPRGGWLGTRVYDGSAHATSLAAVWPGPSPRQRDGSDAGLCVNCHDPHGVKDAAGLVPSLLSTRGEGLCLGCHDGDPATDVASSLARSYHHPLLADPAPGAVQGLAGQVGAPVAPPSLAAGTGSCQACHNPHAAPERTAGTRWTDAPAALLGTARVRVANGPPGSPPVCTPVPAGTPGPVREFEVCFKCHAAGTSRALTRVDVGVAFNPANASFHPLEARGRNATIDPRTFVNGWSADRLVTCSDCHGSDDEVTRGPHGSSVPAILRRRYVASSSDPAPGEGGLCFTCHAWRTYGETGAGAEGRLSRFAPHASHVSTHALSCWACHDAHGSVALPALLALRSPGLTAVTRDATGGTCLTSCHVRTPANATWRSADLP